MRVQDDADAGSGDVDPELVEWAGLLKAANLNAGCKSKLFESYGHSDYPRGQLLANRV